VELPPCIGKLGSDGCCVWVVDFVNNPSVLVFVGSFFVIKEPPVLISLGWWDQN